VTESAPRVRVVRPQEWHTLPVQPPAGAYRRRVRYPILGLLATLALMLVIGFVAPDSSALLVAFGLLLAQGAVIMLIACMAIRPYQKERALGYTTWPSMSELRDPGGGGPP
jgi:hypothetical protein